MKIFVVTHNGKISQEGYRTFMQAAKFCDRRGTQKLKEWKLEDTEGNTYLIHQINVADDVQPRGVVNHY